MTISKIVKHVMSSASEAETAALFYNCKATSPLCTTLAEMGHPQPATPVTTDNSTAQGLFTKSMIPKTAKAYDMRFNWLKCRQAQNQFNYLWQRGALKRADYHSKRHPTKHYIAKRPEYVIDMPCFHNRIYNQTSKHICYLRGCAGIYFYIPTKLHVELGSTWNLLSKQLN